MKCEACEHENIDGARFCAKCGAAIPVAIIGQADPLIGQLVAGRFLITGVLGEGGMGVVYVGEQQMGTTVRKVAVKTLHQHLSSDLSVQARFNREVGTVAQLEHPNTIKVYDFGKTKDGQLYIAMEFVDGRSLADTLIKDGALTSERTVHIMRQICGALDEAHLQGIIHRDLKPENIILTNRAGETDFVKVLDFGIAARTESSDAKKEKKLTQQGMVLGTPPYMSPEQFTGKQLDVRSDVYSLGVMAYEMVTAKLPFDAETPWEWATQHMTVAPKPFEVVAPTAHVPEGLRAAIFKALSKDATQRQGSARQFFAELSGGGRMTVESKPEDPAGLGAGYQATAAMPATPPGAVSTGYAPTAQQPQMHAPPGASFGGSPVTGPAVVAPVAAVPAPPPRRGGGGSNKGLIFGLGGLGLTLVVAIVIVLIRTNQSDDVTPLTASLGGSAMGVAAVVSSEAPVFETQTVSAAKDPTPTSASPGPGRVSGGTPKAPAGTKPPAASSGAAPTTAAAPGTTPAAGTTPATPAGGGNDACARCIASANSGNIAAAQTAYSACSDAGKKSECLVAAKRGARSAAKAAADAKNCAGAKAIVAAANAMGAGSPALTGAVASCP